MKPDALLKDSYFKRNLPAPLLQQPMVRFNSKLALDDIRWIRETVNRVIVHRAHQPSPVLEAFIANVKSRYRTGLATNLIAAMDSFFDYIKQIQHPLKFFLCLTEANEDEASNTACAHFVAFLVNQGCFQVDDSGAISTLDRTSDQIFKLAISLYTPYLTQPDAAYLNYDLLYSITLDADRNKVLDFLVECNNLKFIGYSFANFTTFRDSRNVPAFKTFLAYHPILALCNNHYELLCYLLALLTSNNLTYAIRPGFFEHIPKETIVYLAKNSVEAIIFFANFIYRLEHNKYITSLKIFDKVVSELTSVNMQPDLSNISLTHPLFANRFTVTKLYFLNTLHLRLHNTQDSLEQAIRLSIIQTKTIAAATNSYYSIPIRPVAHYRQLIHPEFVAQALGSNITDPLRFIFITKLQLSYLRNLKTTRSQRRRLGCSISAFDIVIYLLISLTACYLSFRHPISSLVNTLHQTATAIISIAATTALTLLLTIAIYKTLSACRKIQRQLHYRTIARTFPIYTLNSKIIDRRFSQISIYGSLNLLIIVGIVAAKKWLIQPNNWQAGLMHSAIGCSGYNLLSMLIEIVIVSCKRKTLLFLSHGFEKKEHLQEQPAGMATTAGISAPRRIDEDDLSDTDSTSSLSTGELAV